jgi:hypothetical protein
MFEEDKCRDAAKIFRVLAERARDHDVKAGLVAIARHYQRQAHWAASGRHLAQHEPKKPNT